LRPGWFQAWWNAFGDGRLVIQTVRRDGRLAGVAPLHRRLGTLVAVANVHSHHFDFLAEDASAERVLADIVPTRCTRRSATSTATPPAPPSSSAAPGTVGRRPLTVTMQRSPYLEVEGSWEGFERGLSSKFVRDLRRRRRQLADHGAVTSRSRTDPRA
jgi:CelD/BcsL family acetyltransferase involved in cellulose biosynthesis